MKAEQVFHILQGSKAYKFEGSILELTDYYTGDSVKLDLSLIPEDVLEEMIVEDEDDYYE